MALRTAVVIDTLDLLRRGVEQVLASLDIRVVASSGLAGEGLRVARNGHVDFLIVGRHSDLKPQSALKEAKKLQTPPKVVMLIEKAEGKDIAKSLSLGADALLLRSVSTDDFAAAVRRVTDGERVVAPALATDVLGRVGPAMGQGSDHLQAKSGLSPKEQEVLAVLAEGATYKEIAETLIVTQATVKTHLVHIYAKLGVRNREQAVARALALGILG